VRPVRVLRYGASGLLIELESGVAVAAAYRALRRAALSGVTELVPAARTLLVAFADGPPPADLVRAALSDAALSDVALSDAALSDAAPSDVGAGDPAGAGEVVIPVHYDGVDLELVARTAGLPVDEVVRLHSEATYTVAFCGFAPGFGYLVGLPEPLHQARLADPRPRVPAGSVAIAGEYSAVYPGPSPGGWRLLGHTDLTMFDPDADPPSRLTPGDRVRFRPDRPGRKRDR
jgi:allophanate hydrolase subunit 1